MKNHLNNFQKFSLNIFHHTLSFFMHFIPFKYAKILENYQDLAEKLKKNNIKKVMIIVGKTISSKYNLHKDLMDILNKNGIIFLLYTNFTTTPLIKDIEDAALVYKESKAQALIALGGGSIIDAAKAVGVLVSNEGNIKKYQGIFKVKKKPPFMIAIPTTCGSGSETTFAAVIKDNDLNNFIIVSNKIVPDYCLLEPKMLKCLPDDAFNYSIMDTITHAIESYLNISATRKTKKFALKSLSLIKDNLNNAHSTKDDFVAYKALLEASYLAGRSFSRAMVGNIHSLTHGICSYYNLPHGMVNAIILPEMLKEYLKSNYCINKINKISKALNLQTLPDKIHNGLNVVDYILLLNGKFDIPLVLKELKEEDFDKISDHAYQEAHLFYCTPLIFDISDYKEILYLIKSNNN